jgi:tetratricopeptide (TPR) repeat protein
MLKGSKKQIVVSLLVFLALCACLAAQQKPPAGNAPAEAAGKRPAEAKTQAEFNDYNTAYAITGGALMEKAADDFATKYPSSALRGFLYSKAMHEYQTEDAPDKMVAVGEKILKIDPDNTVALVLTATVLSDNLNADDPDRAKKAEEIKKRATHAIATVDSAFAPPANATPEQITAYKNKLMSWAHSSLGITYLKNRDDAGAEKELKQAAELSSAAPDPYVWYHLALAQDHQEKTADALASVEQALRAAGSNADLAKLAASERDRLVIIMKSTGNAPKGSQAPQAQPTPTPLPQ